MAQKRMFDRSIIETDNFLNISLNAKALYFLLGMEADDEGFISPKRVMRLYGGEVGDLKNLIDTGLVIPFKTGVVVITDWNQNNWLDNRRIKPTQYQLEKKMLIISEQKKYLLSSGLASARLEEYSIEESRRVQKRIEQVATPKVVAEVKPFNLEEEVDKLVEGKVEHLRAIGLFIDINELKPTNGLQLSSIIKRNSRAACLLKGYSREQIIHTMSLLKRNSDFKWTIETVSKYIDKPEEIKKLNK